jgi:tRNA nucleotidyltransferase (CCA-adding enzyme)
MGINCYGAEAQIEGFSGYLCEILIIKYNSFKELLKSVSKWQKKVKLSIGNEVVAYFDTPLIFIDPVDKTRNVAAAVSTEKFNLFIRASKEYLKNPKKTFFFPKKIKAWTLEKIKNEIKKQNASYIGIKFDKPNIIDENLYPQIRKAIKSIWDSAKRSDFKIFDMTYYLKNKKILLIIKFDKEKLPKTKIHKGPPVKSKINVKEFKNKWINHPNLINGPYEKDKTLYVEIKRDITDLKDFLEKYIEKLSMGKHLDKSITKKFEILKINKLLTNDMKEFWTEYLDQKMPWER